MRMKLLDSGGGHAVSKEGLVSDNEAPNNQGPLLAKQDSGYTFTKKHTIFTKAMKRRMVCNRAEGEVNNPTAEPNRYRCRDGIQRVTLKEKHNRLEPKGKE